jgi:hypothetical protein
LKSSFSTTISAFSALGDVQSKAAVKALSRLGVRFFFSALSLMEVTALETTSRGYSFYRSLLIVVGIPSLCLTFSLGVLGIIFRLQAMQVFAVDFISLVGFWVSS